MQSVVSLTKSLFSENVPQNIADKSLLQITLVRTQLVDQGSGFIETIFGYGEIKIQRKARKGDAEKQMGFLSVRRVLKQNLNVYQSQKETILIAYFDRNPPLQENI
jgi:hypothetical protein